MTTIAKPLLYKGYNCHFNVDVFDNNLFKKILMIYFLKGKNDE